MKTKKMLQSWSMLLLLVITFALLQEGLAQEEGDTENTGVSGIVETADNFDVSPIPAPEEATNLVNPPSSDDTFTGFDMTAMVTTPPPNTVVTIATGHAFRPNAFFGKIMPVNFRIQTGDIIYESSNDLGDVMTVFADYSLVLTSAEGEEYFHGYLALNSAGSIIIVGTDAKGYQYAFDNRYVIGLTVNGNVFMGISEFLYFYDYDADGNFLALSDSDGHEYEVEFDPDGSFYIADAEGNIGEFYADGSYALYDENDKFLEEGGWLPDAETDDDSSSNDDGDDDDSSVSDDGNSEDDTDGDSGSEDE